MNETQALPASCPRWREGRAGGLSVTMGRHGKEGVEENAAAQEPRAPSPPGAGGASKKRGVKKAGAENQPPQGKVSQESCSLVKQPNKKPNSLALSVLCKTTGSIPGTEAKGSIFVIYKVISSGGFH